MDLSIILVNYNVFDDIKACISKIYEHVNGMEFEIIVVDNNSTDKAISKITSIFPEVKLIQRDSNDGFGAANNSALKDSNGKYIFFVNPDIIFNDNVPLSLMKFLSANRLAGAAGPIQEKPGQGIECYYSFFPGLYSRAAQEFGFYTKAPGMRNRFEIFWKKKISEGNPFIVDWIIGSCLMIKREVYEKIGGFDEAFFLYEEEVDLLYRMKKAGWDSYILPDCCVLHNHHSSTSKLGVIFILYHEYRSRIIFSAKQFGIITGIIRRVLTMESLLFRLVYFTLTNFRSSEVSKKRLKLYFDLLKLNFSSKKKILSSRFVFADYANLFNGTADARL
jgi:GT2 family glycosyltransferase